MGVEVGEPGNILRGKHGERGETAACLEKGSGCLVLLTLGMAMSLWPPVSMMFTSQPPTRGPFRDLKGHSTKQRRPGGKTFSLRVLSHNYTLRQVSPVRLGLSMSKSQATSKQTVPQAALGFSKALWDAFLHLKILSFIHLLGNGDIYKPQLASGQLVESSLSTYHVASDLPSQAPWQVSFPTEPSHQAPLAVFYFWRIQP